MTLLPPMARCRTPSSRMHQSWGAPVRPKANRFYPLHRAQLAVLAHVANEAGPHAVVCGDFNVARESALFGEFTEFFGELLLELEAHVGRAAEGVRQLVRPSTDPNGVTPSSSSPL